MAKSNNGLLIGIGLAVAGVALAAFAFFNKKKFSGIVQYQNVLDASAADIVKGVLNPQKVVFGFVDPRTVTVPLVCIGGQQTNATLLQTNGVFPAITSADSGKGFIIVSSFQGFPMYGIVGYSAGDTLRAAQTLQSLKALPTATVTV